MPSKKYMGSICPKHPELNGERYIKYYRCVGCNRDKANQRTKTYPDKRAEYVKRSTQKTKKEVFQYYGGVYCCVCGYDNIDALCLDHENGGGGVLRKNKDHPWGGYSLYVWLKNNEYPKDLKFRVLCFNCNAIESVTRLRIERKSNRKHNLVKMEV